MQREREKPNQGLPAQVATTIDCPLRQEGDNCRDPCQLTRVELKRFVLMIWLFRGPFSIFAQLLSFGLPPPSLQK